MQLNLQAKDVSKCWLHLISVCIGLFFFMPLPAQEIKDLTKNKRRAIAFLNAHQKQLAIYSDSIAMFAEPSLGEIKSSRLIMDVLKKEGFIVHEKVSGFPTVFIATYGSAKPIIGLFGEYDADPNASNKTVPYKDELLPGGYGHGGHHNVLGIGSLGAALAIKELIDRGSLHCTIRYYGTTAEGSVGAKTYLARDGYFNDLDLSLYWHPAPATAASTRLWDALIDFEVLVTGEKKNVFRGISGELTTLAAMELLISDFAAIRQKTTDITKFNYAIHEWKGALDATPDTIKLEGRIQGARQEDALRLYADVENAVHGIIDHKINVSIKVRRAMHQFLPNATAMKVVHRNMELLGPISYTDSEQAFVKELQREIDIRTDGVTDNITAFSDESQRKIMYGYASDIGDASWIAPEIYFVVRTLPNVPMHRWTGTIFSAHSIAHKGMLHAAKVLSMTIVDYVETSSLQTLIRKDFEENRREYRYRSLIPNNK